MTADPPIVDPLILASTSPQRRAILTQLAIPFEVVERESSVAGLTVVIGNDFSGVRGGRKQVNIATESTVCSPPALS